MEPYTRRVIEIIKAIPEGRVMTYGQVAAAAGSPRGARRVVWILHSLSEAHGLPWHRIVNAKGEIAIQEDESRFTQRYRLEEESVPFDSQGRVALDRCRYMPPVEETVSGEEI